MKQMQIVGTEAAPLGTNVLRFVSEQLLTAIDSVVRAVSTDEERLALNSMLVEIVEEKSGVLALRLVATNGFWAAVYELLDADLGEAEPCAVMIPLASVELIRRLLRRSKESPIHLDLVGHVVSVVGGDSVEWKPMGDDVTFPPWREVVQMNRPIGKTPPAFGVSGSLMIDVARSFAAAGASCIKLVAGETEKDAIHITAENVPEMFAILMPATIAGAT